MGTHYDLTGRVAFITGGTSGINLGIAERFAAEGMKVAVISRSQERVDGAVAQIKETGAECIGFAGDVRDYDALAASDCGDPANLR